MNKSIYFRIILTIIIAQMAACKPSETNGSEANQTASMIHKDENPASVELAVLTASEEEQEWLQEQWQELEQLDEISTDVNQETLASQQLAQDANHYLTQQQEQAIAPENIIYTEGDIPGFLYHYSPELTLIAEINREDTQIHGLELSLETSSLRQLDATHKNFIVASLAAYSHSTPKTLYQAFETGLKKLSNRDEKEVSFEINQFIYSINYKQNILTIRSEQANRAIAPHSL